MGSPRLPWCKSVAVGMAMALALGCSDSGSVPDLAPSDDPADWAVDTSVTYAIEVSAPRWVVPSAGLPAEVEAQASNANVDILYFQDRLFMAWRTGPFHFASDEVVMYVVSSLDGGETWEHEATIDLDSDLREPRFLAMGGELQLMFFQAGVEMVEFDPQRIWRIFRKNGGRWTAPEIFLDQPEVHWRVKQRQGIAYMTSYMGEHYGGADAVVEVYFKQSLDGRTWTFVDDEPTVYVGGVSEVAFEFDADGSLWTVTRNEDCDDSGCGSHVCRAPAEALGSWECPAVADNERYDSPDMFRHGEDIFLIARRDIGGPFGPEGNLLDYSMRPKTTALYRIDKVNRAVVHVRDLPGCGDNAFPSVRRVDEHTFLVANYTSPLDDPDISWLSGQTSSRGTQIYFLTISFVPQ